MIMQYKIIKDISVENLFKAHACLLSLNQFAFNAMRAGYAYTQPIMIEYVMDFIIENNDINWLIEHGFIKEKKPIFYYAGQRFIWSFDEKYYIIVASDKNIVFLASLTNGQRFRSPIQVRDLTQITENEFNKMGGNTTSGTLKPVKK